MENYIKEWEDSQEKIIRCKGAGQCDWSGVDCDEDSNCGEYEPSEIKIPLTNFLLQKLEEKDMILIEFRKRVHNMKDLDPEIYHIVSKNIWDLI